MSEGRKTAISALILLRFGRDRAEHVPGLLVHVVRARTRPAVEAEKAYDWYRDVFGWTIKADPMPEGQPHAGIDTGGGIHGGIGGTPTGQPMVTIYAHVNDLGEYLKRAGLLGRDPA